MSLEPTHSTKGSILAVDDTPANLHLLSRMLSEQGYKVRIVPNGRLALQSVLASLPDLILLDILMPGMDGYQVCERLKADERTRSIPVIFVSALHEGFDKVKAFEVGGVDYITKPFHGQEVIARVESQLRLRAQEQQLAEQNTRLQAEIEERKQQEAALRLIVEGTASTTGDTFMRSCVQYLAEILQVRYAFIAEYADTTPTIARTLAVWTGETWSENFEYNLTDTPCQNPPQGEPCYYPQGVQELFPRDRYLAQLNAQSYFGSPLIDSHGKVIGLLAVLDVQPMVCLGDRGMILKIFAARAGAELERLQAEERERQRAQALKVALQELQRTQAQLIQTEKMSSLGRMVAGIAHEINNPTGFIFGNLTIARQYFRDLCSLIALYQQTYPHPPPDIQHLTEAIELDFIRGDWQKLLNSMQVGTERIHEIVRLLRSFSRLDESALKAVDIHQGIDNTLLLLQHRLRGASRAESIEVIKEYGQLPPIACYASQLNQVFMNLINNAIDALQMRVMPRRITIRTKLSLKSTSSSLSPSPWAVIFIADNGSGMSEEVRQKMFDPFFTTKPVGSGTGLGLSISHQIIVERHGGQIRCLSVPEQGTELIVEIPVEQEKGLAQSEGDFQLIR